MGEPGPRTWTAITPEGLKVGTTEARGWRPRNHQPRTPGGFYQGQDPSSVFLVFVIVKFIHHLVVFTFSTSCDKQQLCLAGVIVLNQAVLYFNVLN